LAAEIAFHPAPGDLPDARDDRRGAGAGDPGLDGPRDSLVQVSLPALLPAGRDAEERAVGPGGDHVVLAREEADQRRAAEVWPFNPVAAE
jgi:hypothetical protein